MEHAISFPPAMYRKAFEDLFNVVKRLGHINFRDADILQFNLIFVEILSYFAPLYV